MKNINSNSVEKKNKQEETKMTRKNFANGWRSSNETPVDGAELLVVLQNDHDKTYAVRLEREGLNRACSYYEGSTVVAWQYCPVWTTGMKEHNSAAGWKSPSEYPALHNANMLIVRKNIGYNADLPERKNIEYGADFVSIVWMKEFDNVLCNGELIAWQYCPKFTED